MRAVVTVKVYDFAHTEIKTIQILVDILSFFFCFCIKIVSISNENKSNGSFLKPLAISIRGNHLEFIFQLKR